MKTQDKNCRKDTIPHYTTNERASQGSFSSLEIEKQQKMVTSQTLNIIVSYANYIAIGISDLSQAFYLSFNNDLLFSISVLNQPPNVVCPSEDYRNALTFKKNGTAKKISDSPF